MAQDGVICQTCKQTLPVEKGDTRAQALEYHQQEEHKELTPPQESAKGEEAQNLIGMWASSQE